MHCADKNFDAERPGVTLGERLERSISFVLTIIKRASAAPLAVLCR